MFHWICPECGREIPPSVRECQACDPHAAALPVPEPVVEHVEAAPVAEAPVVEAPVDELAITQELLAAPPPLPETIAASTPVDVAPAPVPSAEAPQPPEPEQLILIEATPAAELKPEPAIEASPVEEPVSEPRSTVDQLELGAAPPPVAEPEPGVEAAPAPEPVAESATAVEKLELVETIPVAELEPGQLVGAAPEIQPVSEPTLAIEQSLPIQATPVSALVENALLEPPPNTEEVPPLTVTAETSVADLAPVVDPTPVPQPEQIEHIEPEPVAEAAPVAPEAAEQAHLVHAMESEAISEPVPVDAKSMEVRLDEPSIKLHEVPDPLLALAVEIRAAQAARAAALSAPPESTGLLELAEAIGVPEAPAIETTRVSVKPAEPVTQETKLAARENSNVVDAVASSEIAAPLAPCASVALLEPPVSLAPEPQPLARSESVASLPETPPVAESQSELVAVASETVVALPSEPQPEPEGPTLPFAPMQNYTPATSRSIQPVPPPPQILAADSGPRITLPGPTLPPELTRLQDANVVTVIGEQTAQRTKEAIPAAKRRGAPGWLVSLGVMVVLLAIGLGVVFYLLPHTSADAQPAPTPAQAATAPAPAKAASPLAKFIEVTGFRIVTTPADTTKKPEVQYVVVNHSAADISDANIFVTLHSSKPGQPPVVRFSFKVPSLGPFESREMSSPIEKSVRAVTLPDWQDLRADVQISGQ